MKKGTLIFVMTMVVLPAWAQLRPQYTQYILNQYIINPAVAGIEPYTDIKLSHRQQWVGIEDAPVTSYITVHGSIGATRENSNPTSRVPAGENPRGTYYWDNYLSAEPHHGWGVTVFNDKTGPISRLAAYGTYAYHVGLSATTSISGGINLGIVRNSLDMSKLEFDDPNDPVLGNSQAFNRIRPDLGAGIWLYSRSFFGGVSVMQILDQGMGSNAVAMPDQRGYPVFIGTAGFRFMANEQINIIPSVVVRQTKGLPLGIDINAKALYLDRFWGGASYRVNNSVSAMVGMYVNSFLSIGYAYDYTLGNLGQYTGSTHEVVLGFTLGNSYGSSCPTNIW